MAEKRLPYNGDEGRQRDVVLNLTSITPHSAHPDIPGSPAYPIVNKPEEEDALLVDHNRFEMIVQTSFLRVNLWRCDLSQRLFTERHP